MFLSIGVIAWNEEAVISRTLQSLLEQSVFGELAKRNRACEIVCVANGCNDGTVRVAAECMASILREHAHSPYITARVADITARGKVNAWNRFVHEISAREARFLVLMDADILIHRRETVWQMLRALEEHAEASVSVDLPRKDLEFRNPKSLAARLSLSASRMTTSASAQLCGQLYCMRSHIARSLYLPRDLSACEDGLIKALVCSDLLSTPENPARIFLAAGAEHTFEAYTSPAVILKNQKRQVIGQTLIHLLVDKHLRSLTPENRSRLGDVIRDYDAHDPDWLKRLTADHLSSVRYFWRLYPNLARTPFARLRHVRGFQRLCSIPTAVANLGATMVASFMAWRHLRRGSIDYWPKVHRSGHTQRTCATARDFEAAGSRL